MRPRRASAIWRWALWTGAALLLPAAGVSLAGGCVMPPIMLEAPRRPLVAEDFPPRTEFVELRVEPDVALRGVFVPARSTTSATAPVVLDLLESGGSVTTGARSAGSTVSGLLRFDAQDDPLLDETGAHGWPVEEREAFCPVRRHLALLPLLGFSVLCVDYTGVGASDGERSGATLRRDARAAWDEAVRRAGGDPERVILRATSIGALGVAALLQEGAQPGAIVLIAPVRSETVAVNGARALYGSITAFLVGWLLRDPVDADLLAGLAAVRAPVLVIVPRCDAFLLHAERVELLSCVQEIGGVQLVRYADHISLSLASRDLLAEEAWFLLELALTPEPANDWQAAVSRTTSAERNDMLDLLAWMPDDVLAALDPEGLACLIALEDPAGRLDSGAMSQLAACVPDLKGCPSDVVVARLAEAGKEGAAHGASLGFSGSLVAGDFREVFSGTPAARLALWVDLHRKELGAHGLGEDDVERQLLRCALKCAGVPERVRFDPDGLVYVEARGEAGWRRLHVPGSTP